MKTDVFFQNLHPSPQTFPSYCQKSWGGERGSQQLFSSASIGNFFSVILSSMPITKWIDLLENHHTSRLWVVPGNFSTSTHFSSSFFHVACGIQAYRRFVFRLMIERSMHLYPMATKEKYKAYSLWIRVTKSLSWTEGVGEWLRVLEIECQEAACREIKGKQRDAPRAGCM